MILMVLKANVLGFYPNLSHGPLFVFVVIIKVTMHMNVPTHHLHTQSKQQIVPVEVGVEGAIVVVVEVSMFFIYQTSSRPAYILKNMLCAKASMFHYHLMALYLQLQHLLDRATMQFKFNETFWVWHDIISKVSHSPDIDSSVSAPSLLPSPSVLKVVHEFLLLPFHIYGP